MGSDPLQTGGGEEEKEVDPESTNGGARSRGILRVQGRRGYKPLRQGGVGPEAERDGIRLTGSMPRRTKESWGRF